MALIDLSNYDTLLVQSTVGRAGTPDGNIFFDVANGIVELITVEEQATIDMTQHGGGAADANPLSEDDGIRFEALYAFERQERRTDETLRKYDFYFKGTFKFGGAYEIVNNRKFYDTDTGGANSLTGDDRFKLRGSGWIERDANNNIGRIYYGNKSLGNIEALSLPFYQITSGGAPVDYDKDGPIDEAIIVFADNNVDANAYTTAVASAAAVVSIVAATGTLTGTGTTFVTDGFVVGHRFDLSAFVANNALTLTIASVTETVIVVVEDEWASLTDETGSGDEVLTVTGNDQRTYESLKVRTFGQNYDEKVLADSGVTEMGGYSSGFALGESVHLTSGTYTLADVYGGAQATPWTGMGLEKLGAPQLEGGFNEADGNFTWVLTNSVPGNLDQCVAFLDALAQTDDDIDDGAGVTNGKRVGTWYYYDASGIVITRSGADTDGLYIEDIPTADEQLITFTDDAGNLKTRPFVVSVDVTTGAVATADALAWYHAFFLDGPGGNDFNTALAVTVQDTVPVDVKGNVLANQVANVISFAFDYDGDVLGGTAGTDKDVVFECEGDGGATQAKTVFTITRDTTVKATCEPALENNT